MFDLLLPFIVGDAYRDSDRCTIEGNYMNNVYMAKVMGLLTREKGLVHRSKKL